jgi:hypothetical protein
MDVEKLDVLLKKRLLEKDVKWLISNRLISFVSAKNIRIGSLGENAKKDLFFLRARAEEFRIQLNEICEELRKKKIPLALLKESRAAYFKKPDFCSSADIDILVKKSDMQKAARALFGLGYSENFKYFNKKYSDRFLFHYMFKNPNHHFIVEVHWALIDRVYPFKFDEDILWQKRMVKMQDNIFAFEPEFEAIYLMVSTVRDAGATILKNTARIKKLLSASFDFNKFKRYAVFHNVPEFADFFWNIWFNGKSPFHLRFSYRKIIMKVFMKERMLTLNHFLLLLLLYPKNFFYYLIKGYRCNQILSKKFKDEN